MKKVFLVIGIVLITFTSCNFTTEVTEKKTVVNYKTAENEIILSTDSPLTEQITQTRKVYVIRDGFDLKQGTLELPENVTLKFIGGYIYNGTVKFNNTDISGYASFSNCSYQGTLSNSRVELSWFNVEDGKTSNVNLGRGNVTVNTHDAAKIQQIIDCCPSGCSVYIDKVYFTRQPITIKGKISFKGIDASEGVYATMLKNVEYGFNGIMNNTVFVVEAGGDISMQGISVIGNLNLYIGGNLWEKCSSGGSSLSNPYTLCGIDLKQGATITEIHDSSFVGFTYGIRSSGGIIRLIKNSYFSSNRYGFWAENTNVCELRGCRLNSNLLNFHFYERNLHYINSSDKDPTLETDAADIAKLGGGLYLKNCANVNVINCRFEFNFIHVILDQANKNIDIHNAIFDTGTLSQVMINNQAVNNPENYSASNPAFSNVKINSCTFARGARCDVQGQDSKPGFGIFYICDKGNRGSDVSITNNIISDDMEVDKTITVFYEDNIFDIYNTSTSGTGYTVTGNSFYSAAATKVYNVIDDSSGTFNINASGNSYGGLTKKSGKTDVLHITER
ncbi:MAG: hypothetical protein J6Y60_11185 [Treponema sp.]|nr:hypothetical protein [Treponema sp.]